MDDRFFDYTIIEKYNERIVDKVHIFGRTYDPAQWRHAFGVSNLSARTPREISGSYMLHQWYFGRPPTAAKTSAVIGIQ